ncbi:MAG: hypothetical protein IJI46_04455 [Erysipelotrichaceae bacterium]|nr:hypothetical protein [Erysipelotrichaceae bacterium]
MRPAFLVYQSEDNTGGFEQLLRQQKTLYVLSDHREYLPVACFEKDFPDWAYDFVEDGGIAVVSGATRKTFSFDAGFKCKAGIEYIDLSVFNMGKARIRSTVSVFSGSGKGEFTLHENRSIKDNRRPGFYPVFLYKKYGKGTIIYSGIPLTEILTYEGSDLRKTSDVLDYDERVSSIDKAKVGRALRDILREAMNLSGHPYLSLYYYPDGAKSIFAYSIDGDGLLTRGVNDLIEVSEKTNTKLVFYINKQLCENEDQLEDKLSRISKHNIIASHGAIHNGKDSYEENVEDLVLFDTWMKSLGFEYVKSYAAPRGMYCLELGRALKDMGYVHSRDFGYAIDDHPYFPYCEGVQEGPLQIPCDGFNVCRLMGIREEEGKDAPSAEEILEAYKKQIDLKLERDQPLLFFCHPQYFGLYAKEVYPKLIEYVSAKGVLLSDYVSYGDFWLRRDKCEYDAEYENGDLKIIKNKWSKEMRICINGQIAE